MRLKMSRVVTKYVRNRNVVKDDEGVTSVEWGTATAFNCEVWSNASYLQTNVEGQSLDGDFYMHIEGDYEIQVEDNHEKYVFDNFTLRQGDGICLYASGTDEPDFIISGITPYNPLLIVLTRNNVR